jgi:hypothetical protein
MPPMRRAILPARPDVGSGESSRCSLKRGEAAESAAAAELAGTAKVAGAGPAGTAELAGTAGPAGTSSRSDTARPQWMQYFQVGSSCAPHPTHVFMQ